MFRIYVHAYTPVGEFSGFASDEIAELEQALLNRDDLQEILRNCDSFTLLGAHDGYVEITLATEVIKNSVFKFFIKEVLEDDGPEL